MAITSSVAYRGRRKHKYPAGIAQRIARIKSTWSPATRARRAALGRDRRQQLAALLGLATQKVCA